MTQTYDTWCTYSLPYSTVHPVTRGGGFLAPAGVFNAEKEKEYDNKYTTKHSFTNIVPLASVDVYTQHAKSVYECIHT